ncbi:hypothetical protein CLAVI_000414 [Candidatus Clavichlamydia salmonicola]|uniref:hypothetical protein n=1 Tax=Candidatus Clavichlamydia salmonicola TaxID=469812 RepID=UPI001890E2D7|nr:hypothetical protein [Candidatus Clavichlamydia salmonicola]MBF5050795.1 hypothetical protein [Candidatus Clavichlamydia salmonicola]
MSGIGNLGGYGSSPSQGSLGPERESGRTQKGRSSSGTSEVKGHSWSAKGVSQNAQTAASKVRAAVGSAVSMMGRAFSFIGKGLNRLGRGIKNLGSSLLGRIRGGRGSKKFGENTSVVFRRHLDGEDDVLIRRFSDSQDSLRDDWGSDDSDARAPSDADHIVMGELKQALAKRKPYEDDSRPSTTGEGRGEGGIVSPRSKVDLEKRPEVGAGVLQELKGVIDKRAQSGKASDSASVPAKGVKPPISPKPKTS